MSCTVYKDCGRASKFRRDRATLYRQSESIQPSGQPVVGPVAFATVNCLVRNASKSGTGREFKNGDGLDATNTYVIEMRYRTDVDPTHQVEVTGGKYKGRTLNVVSVTYHPDEGQPREAHLLCKYNATPNNG